MIDVFYTSLTSQEVQHRVFYPDGHPSRLQPCPTGRNFGEQTGTGVFPLVIAFGDDPVSVFLLEFGADFSVVHLFYGLEQLI